MQHIARHQTPPAMAAKLAQFKRAATAQIGRDIQPACDQQIAAHTAALRTAHAQALASGNLDHDAARHRHTIQLCAKIRAGQAQAGGGSEGQSRTGDGDFQPCRSFVIAQQPIAKAEGLIIHRPRRRHTHRP